LNKKAVLGIVASFLLGFLISNAYTIYSFGLINNADSFFHFNSLNTQKLQSLESKISKDKPSPSNWIKESQISVHEDEVILKIKNPKWAVFTDTKSMDPVIDSTSKAIEIVPESIKDIHVGDIVAYKSAYMDGVVAHRVIETGQDGNGWYAKLKGDNNPSEDPEKVRFSNIRRVVVAIIY